ncbi:hypothetical protein SAMN02745883_01365 [Caminicella sporogenes DSM 14501]|uniref:DUF8042 domain-containing protein n=1 Tax=Caminicella sporogenes DSM 14501 TaxID=1121266 RepID=A0A1M6Q2M7_9FIRM|nr:hypothetical protein [Caminicella sporogenes]SHK14381.1 hypothetical protein SAMN02745883_01365 [Caminicella sporogenes DSM 14501]
MNKQKQMQEVLNGLYMYLERLISGIIKTAELYQGGNEGKANENMIDIIDGINWIIEGITATSEIQKEKINITDMNEYFDEIVQAFENSDYILLSDLLEYEIVPVLKNWKEKIFVSIGV